MKKAKSDAMHRVRSVRAAWREMGRLLAHLLIGAVLLLCLVAMESIVIVAVRTMVHMVGEHWFTSLMEGLDAVFVLIDVALSLWWVVKSAKRAAQESSHE
ncbi:hypothetical protein [Rhodanobacter denitrificans]|uniref:Uncharacterized protein n=1 Tax=Rhodanobacter denitrificans TaxID=666685 RepID=M4NG27_9GAMM|nr:hypothetical protein [Rhodanobacter denitrificans]AGG89022.1 hypothetical protein R2APBS1_1898 [Rhodanobacter denitrificans]UJJ53051.1 hypothetical protein LRK52_18255 [Rhodanobacter denitrificans]